MLVFLDPAFENLAPKESTVEWTCQWEDEQLEAFREAEKRRNGPAMLRAARAIQASLNEWNPEIFLVFSKKELRSIQRQLRAYIDEWIDTGFVSDGSEFPDRREFKPRLRDRGDGTAISRPKWNEPPEDYAPPPAAVCAIAKLHHGKAVPSIGRYRIDVEDNAKSPVEMSISPGGGVNYFLREKGRRNTELRAALIFYWFYRSNWVFWLRRCNRCKALSMPTTKPRKRYERGWHCDKCRNSAAAQAATDARRARLREQWLGLAVDAYREYRSSPRRSTNDVSAFIAERVNKRLPYNSRIKRNTITRNFKEIQIRAAKTGAKRNAKG